MRGRYWTSALVLPLIALSVGIAHADSTDDDFVQQAHSVGVNGAAADLISNGHAVCKSLASGSNPDDVTDAFVNQLGFQSGVAAKFVAVSVKHYCPQYGNLPFSKPH
ncbi:MAG: hypothetical protein CK428_30565 [Mycobacterium sp.]|nr:MAG: hypothetical protein CK428_30565 [Mycobacterium sp.]